MMNQLCTEPSLDEVLADAVVRLLMRSDGVKETDIRNLLRPKTTAPSLRSSEPAASRPRSRWLRPTWLVGLVAIAFIALPEIRQAFQSPAAAIRSELTAAAVELAVPVGPQPTDAQLNAIRRHFTGRDATIDAAAWPQIIVTLRHVDRDTCGDVLGAARRIEGLVVVELERYPSVADCGADNDLTWLITP
jgi:hypothetical protein